MKSGFAGSVSLALFFVGCVAANDSENGPEGAADVFDAGAEEWQSVDQDDGAGRTIRSISRSIKVDIVNLSHNEDSSLFLDDLCRRLSENQEAYGGGFTYRLRDRNATSAQGKGTVAIDCQVSPVWSSIRSGTIVVGVVDDLPPGLESDRAGTVYLVSSLGAGRGILIEDDYAMRTTAPAARKDIIMHEVGHCLGMADDYPSNTIMGDFAHSRTVTTPGQRLEMFGPLALGERLRSADGKAQVRSLLGSTAAEYDASRLD